MMEKKEYIFGEYKLLYLIDDDRHVSLWLLPRQLNGTVKEAWLREAEPFSQRSNYNREWKTGSLVHLHLRHHSRGVSGGMTMKYSQSTDCLRYESQSLLEDEASKTVMTKLVSPEGYEVFHSLTWIDGRKGLICNTNFRNTGQQPLILEMLSSFAFENLSPFQEEDGNGQMELHRFRGGWAVEGRHVRETLESLALEKAWCAPFTVSERFGSAGSFPVGRYFPLASVEDRKNKVFWTAQLCHNATWQMEVTRYGDNISFSGGLGDYEFGQWSRTVEPGEEFEAPTAFLSCVQGDIAKACQSVTDMQNTACDNYGEKGLPIVFNEYCASWGDPTQDKMMNYAKCLDKKGIRYLVIDAGWSRDAREQRGNGEWLADEKRFPDMRQMSIDLRQMGYIPGLWMEFEVTTEGSPAYSDAYDDMHLKSNGVVINVGGWRTFWDFRRKDVREYLQVHVIDMLIENEIGYLKVDYNGCIGIGCDCSQDSDKNDRHKRSVSPASVGDTDSRISPGEGLRQHLAAVREFFQEIKRQIPDIIIENCASGGHRLEPSMLGVSAMSSFSDAHESREIPYIAANEHYLMLPRQCQIWVVLHADQSVDELRYRLASGFLGRICLSGEIDKLSDEQWIEVEKGLAFYRELEGVLMEGITRIYGNRSRNMHDPSGTQVLVREGKEEIMVVCHSFQKAEERIKILAPEGFYIANGYHNQVISVKGGEIIVEKMRPWTACAVLLKRNGIL